MEKALQSMIDNMPEKTGKSLEQWFEVLELNPFEKHTQGVQFLKGEHKVSHGFANTIITLFRQKNEQQQDLVTVQYAGKASLKPLYETLIKFAESLGNDVTVTPKKASVSLIRKHQFALIKPATKSRIDLGLKLKGIEVQGVLENSGPFGTMCTHRVRLNVDEAISDEVKSWIKQAYEMSV